MHAHAALLRWTFDALAVSFVYLNVLDDNARAIATYEKAGFRAAGQTPLRREEFERGYRLVPAADGDADIMKIARDTAR